MDDAGRELDKRVAVEVMGWTLPRTFQNTVTWPNGKTEPLGSPEVLPVPQFSTDIAAAWSVLMREPFGPRDFTLDHRFWKKETNWPAPWRCRIISKWFPGGSVTGYGDTAPLAIVHAALAATAAVGRGS